MLFAFAEIHEGYFYECEINIVPVIAPSGLKVGIS